MHRGAHRVAGGVDGGEDLAVDGESVEPHSKETEALIGGHDDAQRLAVDFDGDGLGRGRPIGNDLVLHGACLHRRLLAAGVLAKF